MASTSLPPAARALVDATLARARLRGRERAAVRAELESHFRDGLDRGVGLEQLIESYGDPVVAGALIGRAKRRARSGVDAWAIAASAVLALVYIAAVVRLEMAAAPPSSVAIALDQEAATVVHRVELAEDGLGTARGVLESFAIAADLRARHTLWAETESIILLDRTFRAADSLLDASGRAALADRLAHLAARETLRARRTVIDRARPVLVERLYGRNGRLDHSGLKLLQRTKGVDRLTIGAALLEPLYFAPRRSRAWIRRAVDAYVGSRLRRADAASASLAARLLVAPSTHVAAPRIGSRVMGTE